MWSALSLFFFFNIQSNPTPPYPTNHPTHLPIIPILHGGEMPPKPRRHHGGPLRVQPLHRILQHQRPHPRLRQAGKGVLGEGGLQLRGELLLLGVWVYVSVGGGRGSVSIRLYIRSIDRWPPTHIYMHAPSCDAASGGGGGEERTRASIAWWTAVHAAVTALSSPPPPNLSAEEWGGAIAALSRCCPIASKRRSIGLDSIQSGRGRGGSAAPAVCWLPVCVCVCGCAGWVIERVWIEEDVCVAVRLGRRLKKSPKIEASFEKFREDTERALFISTGEGQKAKHFDFDLIRIDRSIPMTGLPDRPKSILQAIESFQNRPRPQ